MKTATFRPLLLSLFLGATAVLFACGGGGSNAPALATSPVPAPLLPGWQSAAPVVTDATVMATATVPQVALDDAGNAMVVWAQSDGTRQTIWASRYNPSVGWGTPTRIDLIASNAASKDDAFAPQIGMDAAGNATAVWMQYEGTRSDIWANRYTARTGAWDTAALIESDDTGAMFSPEVAVSPGGNAMVVWTQQARSTQALWVNHYGTGQWGQAKKLVDAEVSKPKVAIDASGNAMVAWMQFDGVTRRYAIRVQRYDSTNIWGLSRFLSDSVSDAFNPTITFDSAGNAFAAWQEFDGARDSIWTRLYSLDNGWRDSPVQVAGSSGAAAMNPRVALSASGSGSAVVVWQQVVNSNNTFYTGVFANRFDMSMNQWGSTTHAVTTPSGSVIDMRAADDKQGGAIAVWSQLEGTRRDVWTSHYGPDGIGGAVWGPAQRLETDNTGNAEIPHIGADKFGNAVAVWSQTTGAFPRIWANIFINDKQ